MKNIETLKPAEDAPRPNLQNDKPGDQNAEPGRFDDALFDAAVWGD
jgi:hypothetical protein